MRKVIGLLCLLTAFSVYFGSDFANVEAQNPSRITQRCQPPNASTYASAGFAAVGDLLINPCPGRATIFNGNVSFNANIIPFASNTNGAVVFVGESGQLAQDRANFAWNDTSNYLVIGNPTRTISTSNFEIASQTGAGNFNLVGTTTNIQGNAHSGTLAAPTPIASGFPLITVNGRGYNGTSYQTGAGFTFITSELWSGAARGTRALIQLTPNGSTVLSNYWTIEPTLFKSTSGAQFIWTNNATNSASGTPDTGWARYLPGVIRATDGGTTIRGLIGGGAAVASAAALPLPTGRVFHVTGTTNIDSITSTGFANGACITMIFDDVLTVADANNLILSAAFVTTANDTLSLCYDGTNWYETGRSVN